MRRSNESRSASTQAALLAAARQVFVENGYTAAATTEVVELAGVTRGALYHHFDGKAGLFKAVIEQEAAAVAQAIAARTANPMSANRALLDGAAAYFEAMSVAGRVRLLLIEGPAVLGVEAMDAIDGATGRGELRLGLQLAADTGKLDHADVGPLAAMLSAAFDKAALDVAAGASQHAYLSTLKAVIGALVKDE